jgi:hypothetical protein
MHRTSFIGAARVARVAAAALIATLLFGCAAVKLPPPVASADTVQSLRGANVQPVKAGTFALAPDKAPAMDREQGGLRGSTVSADTGSFAQYLKDVIVSELKAAGLYDETSKTVIQGQLTDSQLDAAMGTGTGRLAARFTVTRDGQQVYQKELSVDGRWESSFVGAVALPAAINNYGQFYKALARKLFDDPEFRAAAARK